MGEELKQCGFCKQPLKEWCEYHTHESCLLFILNGYREFLGKLPIIIDIEAEDKELKDRATANYKP